MRTPAVLGALILGAIIGGMAVEYWSVKHGVSTAAAQPPAASSQLTAAVAHLKSVLPTQSHTMQDVGYHWSGLWFAAQKKNWPLAKYYFDEARQAVRWTILMRPVRQLPGGGTVNIKGIFDAVDPTAFAALQIAIEDEDSAQFATTYQKALEGCYTCHVAVGKPYLHPVVPTTPPTTVIGFDPIVK